jgi:hypothetical protein
MGRDEGRRERRDSGNGCAGGERKKESTTHLESSLP